MKILYLHQYFKFPSENGGTRSYDLATGFAEKGYEIEIVTSTSDPEYNQAKRWVKLQKDGLIVHYIYLPYGNHLSYFKRSLVFFQFLWFASFKLLAIKTDLVLATSTPLSIGIPALIKKWMTKTPFVFEARDVWPEAVIAIGAIKNIYLQKLLYQLERIIYKNAAAIVPLSVDMKKSIVDRYPQFKTKPIEIIENISEIRRFQNSHNQDKSLLKEKIGFVPRFTVLYAGTFGRVNGIGYVVKLAKEVMAIDPTVVFVLIGAGAEKEMITQLALDEGVLNKNVFILDPVSKQELPQLYYECNMGSSFVIPVKELWANSANKFFDTLAAGKPILINHPGWQKDKIESEDIGYVLPEKIDKFAAHDFVNYTQNVALIQKQSIRAFEVAKGSYSLEIAVEKYIGVFNKIL